MSVGLICAAVYLTAAALLILAAIVAGRSVDPDRARIRAHIRAEEAREAEEAAERAVLQRAYDEALTARETPR